MLKDHKEDSLGEEGGVEEIAVMVEGREEQERKETESISYTENAITLDETSNLHNTADIEHNMDRSGNATVCEEDNYHQVWRPKKQPHLAELVMCSKELQERQRKSTRDGTVRPPLDRSLSSRDLFIRQQQLFDRIQATQAVLKDSTDQIVLDSADSTAKKPPMSFKEASRRVISDQRKRNRGHSSFSDVVTQYLAKMESERDAYGASSQNPQTPTSSIRFPSWHSKPQLSKQSSSQGVLGAIPIDEWHKLVEESLHS